ncbi:hypothetical protein B0T24DRAFT_506133, partial [Lasiosphaeria ovina]
LWCGCKLGIDHSDCDAAIRQHNGQILVPIGQAYYSIHESVVSFVCTPRSNSGITPVDEPTVTFVYSFSTDNCGWYVPGTYKHGDLNVAPEDIGYMNYSPGLDFCGRAEASSADHC